ncbi:PIN2/TERF1-interacting telomerase inhibitor 1 [Esox lucius]|uniref:G-patch domain-containing protein n=2 Tax=Esox lucius TaxID=8010 RepID=A0A3P8XLG9_ESOLU|nr:PIN2/TERF1-interacting telomerase inhibitor 1 [Esox lucius]
MSMLAEPRRKQKWSVDPRNSAWSNDESKFGHKMLERMGWSKGKGLGRTEQGSTEHIRVKVKNNQLGLGTTASYEDNWIAHQDDFNQLLADLNSCHSQTATNEAPSEEKQQEKSFSLEEKSKTSRKRVHYMKFTKGKDLSSRSQNDLACIFGKRGSTSRDQEEESQDEKETRAATKVMTYEPDVEAITKTVTSNLTMQDYFAQRMAQLKKGRGEAPTPDSSPESSDTAQQVLADNPQDVISKKKKKKRKRVVEENADVEREVEECVGDVVLEDHVEVTQSLSEKKKKKKKLERVLASPGHCSATPDVELNCNDDRTSEKKKNKKKHKVQATEADLVNEHKPPGEERADSEVVDKKRQEKNSDWNDEDKELKVEKKKCRKDKKKRKRVE